MRARAATHPPSFPLSRPPPARRWTPPRHRASHPDRSRTPCIAMSAHSHAHRYTHAIVADLLEPHLRKIGNDIRENIGGRIADFVQHLLGNRRRHDQTASIVRLRQHETAIGAAGCDRITDIVPVRHLPQSVCTPPVDCGPHSRIWPTRLAGREPIVIVRRPLKLVHQDAERQRAIRATPGDDDIGAAIERRRNRQRAEIGVCRQQLRRQRLAGRRFARRCPQRIDARQHIVAFNHRDPQRQSEFSAGLLRAPAWRLAD